MGIGFPLILIGSVLAASISRPALRADEPIADDPDRLATGAAPGA
jgi:hypothetical protein